MISDSDRKKAVRLRMQETGEKYTTALRYLEANPDEMQRLVTLHHGQRMAKREGENGAAAG